MTNPQKFNILNLSKRRRFMIELKNIKKTYDKNDDSASALKGINLCFRDQEFVSIVGQSGCGKTTLLNVIGGLDNYSSGDILVDGVSTKQFKDTDWDNYRNTSVGFVFQSYNLIPHLNVVENVMMALSLSGIGFKERFKRAKQVLAEVGLENKLKSKPNELSGGQMQRVAIARALVNNPKILLADEPTGALDSKTSVQIMELIKKVSKNRLVVMVTHNNELAQNYSDRIIEILDGKITNDSNPFVPENETQTKQPVQNFRKPKMSFWEALKSSFKNLFLKKGRTIATAIAGSIGIIGIGLVLSLSSGINNTISSLQSNALAGFPITISQQVYTNDFSKSSQSEDFPKENVFHYDDPLSDYVSHTNIFTNEFLTYLNQMDTKFYNSISYTSGVATNVIYKTSGNSYGKVPQNQTNPILPTLSTNFLSELPNSTDFILSQYDILAGKYAEQPNELVLVVDSKNKVSKSILQGFGFDIKDNYSVNDFVGKTFTIVGNNDYYFKDTDNLFKERTDYENLFNIVSENSFQLTIVGILRVKETSSQEFLSTGIAYSYTLTETLLQNAQNSTVVQEQKLSPNTSVLTGLPFNMENTFKNTMLKLGGDSTPTSIQIYPKTFKDKEQIKKYIDNFNDGKEKENQIIYTDLAETLTSTISNFVNIITIVLSVIAAISLVVSTIMISIIVYVSVIERTKEIGIMRSIGARKKDVARIFTSEAVSIGLLSGVFGVLISYLLDIPLSLLVSNLMESSFMAMLPVHFALILIAVSVLLTFVAGLLPASKASKKDPVKALRTE